MLNRNGHGGGGGGGTKRSDANTPNTRDTKRGRESPDDLARFLILWISELRSKSPSKVLPPRSTALITFHNQFRSILAAYRPRNS